MTREEMAMEVDTAVKVASVVSHGLSQNILAAAAAELRKTCATCRHFDFTVPPIVMNCKCPRHRDNVPADGSGFCHRWEGKP